MQANAKAVRAEKAPTVNKASGNAANNTTSAAMEAETRGSTTSTQPVNAPATDSSSGTPAPAAKRQLTPKEEAKLERCEKIIRRGFQKFWEVGKALSDIRNGGLYLKTHDTFEAYLEDKWGIGSSHGYRLIKAQGVVEVLSPIGEKFQLPAHESVLRPLVGLKPEDQRAAWKTAFEKAGDDPVTAKLVEEAAAVFKSVKAKNAKAEAPAKEEPKTAVVAAPVAEEVKAAAVPPPVKEDAKPAVKPAPTEQALEDEVIDAKTAMKYLAKIEEMIEEEYFNEEEAVLALKLVKRLRSNIAEELDYDPSMDGEEYNPDPGYIEGDDEFDPDPEYVPDDDCEPDTGESQGEE